MDDNKQADRPAPLVRKMTGAEAFDSLTEARRIFVMEWVKSFDRYKALQASGSAIQDYRAAQKVTWKYLTDPTTKAAIIYWMEEVGITPERIKATMAKVAFDCDAADFDPFVRGEKSLQELRDMGVDTSLIKSVSVNPTKYGEARSLEFHDAMKAREFLARTLSMLQDTKNIKVSGEVRIIDMTKMSTEELERLAHATEQDAIDVECEPAVKQLPAT